MLIKDLTELGIRKRLLKDLELTDESLNDVISRLNNEVMARFMDGERSFGILFLYMDDSAFCTSFDISPGLFNKQTGRAVTIYCDFCKTWQSGKSAARISFKSSEKSTRGFLVCSALNCSDNARMLTPECEFSNTQIPNSKSIDERLMSLSSSLRHKLLGAIELIKLN